MKDKIMETDIPVRATHHCENMPWDTFAEVQETCWHLHATTVSHAKFRQDLAGNICPYCHKNLMEEVSYENS